MIVKLYEHKELCSHPKKSEKGEAICGCRNPKNCKGVQAVRSDIHKMLKNDVKNDLLGVFDM